MPETPSERATKTIELAIEIAADPNEVWRAISESEELSNWFPPEARVEPGVGGSIWLSWGESCQGTGRIEIWEPARHLRWSEGGAETSEDRRILVDFRIEGKGGSTVVRLVNSGFEASDDWAEYVDLVASGWRYFLLNLKHYLERHAGRRRTMVSARHVAAGHTKEEVWDILMGPVGLASTPLPAADGAPVTLWSGDLGVVQISAPPMHFSASLPSLDDALVLIELEPGGDRFHVGVWLSLYNADKEQADVLQRGLDERLAALLGD